MTRYMLDTKAVGYLVKSHPSVARRVSSAPIGSVGLSAITQAELAFGLASRPAATRLRLAVREFLLRVSVLPWDSAVAERYGSVRAELERHGKVLAPRDLLIAAHALQVGAVLVTSDRAFAQLAGLPLEDWTVAP